MPRKRSAFRAVLLLSLSLLLLFAGGVGFLLLRSFDDAKLDLAGTVDFGNAVAIPPMAQSTVADDGTRVFDLTMQRGETDFAEFRHVPTLGINQSYLGPTLRAERGERVRINVTNEIGETSTLHWHGMHLPARMDGGPHQVVADGQTWSPSWRIDQPAASLWYHPHMHGQTADHVYRGLAGMFLIDDARSRTLSLPKTYGVDDVPVIVQDKKFDDGRLDDGASLFSPVGFLGDRILVNGTPEAYFDVTTERIRLRLLNASNARVYNFGFPDQRAFHLVATDGGLLSAPVELESLVLSPGERAEIVVRMEPGETTTLQSHPADVAGDFLQQRWSGGDDTLDVLQLRAGDDLHRSPPLPDRLGELPDVDADAASRSRSFTLTTPRINAKQMDMDRIDETVEVGTTELWAVTNADGTPHNFHVHDVGFRMVEVNGEAPPPHLVGRKDTVMVPAGTTITLALTFTDYTDPDVPYMFHCHVLRHEDEGMMGQFVVVKPGGEPGRVPDHDHQAVTGPG